jgi:hypothetical protein
VVDELVQAGVHEAGELDFRHGFEALGGKTHAHPGNTGFRQRGVQYPLVAEFGNEAVCCPEHSAVDAHVLPQHQHGFIRRHGRMQGAVYRVDQGHLRHGQALSLKCAAWAASAAGSSAYR